MSTAILWFRKDLRVNDSPMLAAASEYQYVLPVFIFDRKLLSGRFSSPRRTKFLLGCLADLGSSLEKLGAPLTVCNGEPAEQLLKLTKEVEAKSVLWHDDVTPYAKKRDSKVEAELTSSGIEVQRLAGNYAVDVESVVGGEGQPLSVFTPFWKRWQQQTQRELYPRPGSLELPPGFEVQPLPTEQQLGIEDVGELIVKPGESAARKCFKEWIKEGIYSYGDQRQLLSQPSSELSAYINFGCLSAVGISKAVARLDGKGPAAYLRQLVWRDFYASVIANFPDNLKHEFKEKYRKLKWDRNEQHLEAWQNGQTGYPVVDAAMRQLNQTGFMHNRARLIIGSFLTKDLHIDWREGERYFMQQLLDGDVASNNGNWQWIASVGVDPAPYFRRMYNPTKQQERFDPDGEYVRRWVPELKEVPDEFIAEPWKMSAEQQGSCGVQIGSDYPERIVDHAHERNVAAERYRAVSEEDG